MAAKLVQILIDNYTEIMRIPDELIANVKQKINAARHHAAADQPHPHGHQQQQQRQASGEPVASSTMNHTINSSSRTIRKSTTRGIRPSRKRWVCSALTRSSPLARHPRRPIWRAAGVEEISPLNVSTTLLALVSPNRRSHSSANDSSFWRTLPTSSPHRRHRRRRRPQRRPPIQQAVSIKQPSLRIRSISRAFSTRWKNATITSSIFAYFKTLNVLLLFSFFYNLSVQICIFYFTRIKFFDDFFILFLLLLFLLLLQSNQYYNILWKLFCKYAIALVLL